MRSAMDFGPARAVSIGTLFVALVLAACVARGGVQDTPHNLIGSGRTPLDGDRDDSTAVCAFCHTPHGQDRHPPLWQVNRDPENDGFRTYDSFGRSNLADVDQNGSVSLSCMSCHDGVQALNVALVTAPREVAARPQRAVSSMVFPGSPTASVRVRVVAPRVDQSISHPVGMPYGAWQDELALRSVASGGPAPLPLSAPDAMAQSERGFRTPQSAVIDGVTVWWLETGASGRQRADIHLYSRTVGENDSAPFVECASCHDPHAERPNFLRTSTGGPTALCASCHAM